ncbi:uncharacterized protein LOC132283707 [Cornus florida]|uniref:uncharacterized protein LOC132283707 n=1 Tax=Cornus florida TaxID=4283 RepID=UPI00289814FB|nr:uncharacterized protein LOC132283707 [Cornus florida]
MAMVVASKRLLLVLFFLLCFIPFAARARSLRAYSNIGEEKGHDHDVKFMAKEDTSVPDSRDLMMLDYTPARKKSPIHN